MARKKRKPNKRGTAPASQRALASARHLGGLASPTQFQAGHAPQGGRPKGAKSLVTIMRERLERILKRKGGEDRVEAIMDQALDHAETGSANLLNILMRIMESDTRGGGACPRCAKHDAANEGMRDAIHKQGLDAAAEVEAANEVEAVVTLPNLHLFLHKHPGKPPSFAAVQFITGLGKTIGRCRWARDQLEAGMACVPEAPAAEPKLVQTVTERISPAERTPVREIEGPHAKGKGPVKVGELHGGDSPTTIIF